MAKWEITLSTNSLDDRADLDNLKAENPVLFPRYALCLPKYSKLDGRFSNVTKVDIGNIGYMSGELSGADGKFHKLPTIKIKFARKKTSSGFYFVFNKLSGDYCNNLMIRWYKYGKVVAEREYYPDAPEYLCNANVGLYDEALVLFKSTSKPYRYLWLSQIKNIRLTDSEGLRIVYNDVAFLGKEHTVISSNDANPSAKLNLLLLENAVQFPYYSPALPLYSKLDGSFANAPETLVYPGFISKQISDANGGFTSPPQITFTLSEAISSIGIELIQNNASGDYCDRVNVKWYLANTLAVEQDFAPNAVDYLCYKKVEAYDKVIVTFKHTSKPYRYAFLTGFQYGAIHTFTKKEITACSVFEEIAPIGDRLPISTLDFSIRDFLLDFNFEKAQRLYVYFDEQIIGDFYLKTATRNNTTEYSMQAENVISLLEGNSHKGGFYDSADVEAVIKNEIFAGIDVNVDTSKIKGRTLTGWLPYDTCRNNLAQICFALGCIIDTSFESGVYVYPYDSAQTPTEIPDSLIYANAVSVDQEEIVTGVKLTMHSWVKSTADKSDNLYEEVLSGQTLIKFGEPHYDLSITGGSIVESGSNYAVITGSGSQVTLTGKNYQHIQQVISMEKDRVYRNRKFVESTNSTLVTQANAAEVLRRMFDYYTSSQSMKATIILEDVQLSDIVTLKAFDGERHGIVKSLDMNFYGEIKAEAEIKCLT